MASSQWEEVKAAHDEKRHELSLQGPTVNKRIESAGLDPNVFKLNGLNLLKIAGTPIESLSESLGNLTNLTSLMLENNKLKNLPESVGNLTSLKFLDVSGNKLESLPQTLSQLVNLQSLNANLNLLTSFPDVSNLKQLAYLYISKNKLTSLPDGICDPKLTLLSIIEAGDNEINGLPSEMSNLVHLIKLDVSSNKLTILPNELSECPKLKEVVIAGNNLKDRKQLKLSEHSTKALLNHLSALLDKERAAAGGGKGKKDKKKKGRGNKNEKPEVDRDVMSVLQFEAEKGIVVTATPEVMSVRQYIVCCIMKNLDFSKSANLYKRFIQLQTKLHEGVCEKRQSATIATHDLKLLKGPLVYNAIDPEQMHFTPLNKAKATTAAQLVKELRDEADAFRKENKRSTLSGIHKYLDLLKDKQLYPCVRDADNDVISFPPITNCEKSKISKTTQDILVEVTSTVSLDMCKKVMEEMLLASLLLGIGCGDTDTAGKDEEAKKTEEVENGASEDAAAPVDTSRMKFPQKLTLEQVKVVDHTGNLRVIYPSRIDLQNPAFDVVRNYE